LKIRKKIAVVVSSDLVTDQRVLKECNTLHQLGFEIEVYCRILKHSLPLPDLPYKIIQMRLCREAGVPMYLHLNLVLFIKLITSKASIIWSNDLDTLLPAFLVSRLKKKTIIYDSHELYAQTPSLIYRPFKRKIWQSIEDFCLPKLKHVLTVNNTIKREYEDKYKIKVNVVRNVPYLNITKPITPVNLHIKNRKILILQGAGIHHNRGGLEIVQAIQFLDDDYYLIVAGSGDALDQLKQIVIENRWESKVLFTGLMPYQQLLAYTKTAHLGIIPEKIEISSASYYTLPNKLFDYIHAGLPVLSTRALEIEKIIKQYDIGAFINELVPQKIAETIHSIFSNEQQLNVWRANAKLASEDLCWEREQEIIINVAAQALSEK